jgi:hypothetical protein
MLAGSTSTLLETALSFCTAIEYEQRPAKNADGVNLNRQSPAMKKLYYDIVQLLKWTDRQVCVNDNITRLAHKCMTLAGDGVCATPR